LMQQLQPTIREFDLPREPFLRLIEANRMDQRISEYATWADLKHYCVHSADPVGRLVLGLLRLANQPEVVCGSAIPRAPVAPAAVDRASRVIASARLVFIVILLLDCRFAGPPSELGACPLTRSRPAVHSMET